MVPIAKRLKLISFFKEARNSQALKTRLFDLRFFPRFHQSKFLYVSMYILIIDTTTYSL